MALKDNFRTEAIVLPPKWGVYGKHGSGNSTLALSSGKKTVVLNTDNGIEEVLQQTKGDIWVQDFIPEVKEAKGANQVSHETNSKMWLGLLDTLRDLAREKHDRQVLVIDSLDAADTLAHSHSCHELGVAAIDEADENVNSSATCCFDIVASAGAASEAETAPELPGFFFDYPLSDVEPASRECVKPEERKEALVTEAKKL